MKVRFNSPKEAKPTHDDGLKVLYAPARRQAFRLRWYLILLLVAAPFLFFIGKVAYDLLIVEVPAQILFSVQEVRSRESAQVMSVRVKEGDTVTAGQVLFSMDNPEWRKRLVQLQALSAELSTDSTSRPQSLTQVMDAQLVRAEERLTLLQGLLAQGAATRGEVLAAANERDQRLADRLAFEIQQERLQQQPETTQALTLHAAEQQWLEERLAALTLTANEDGVVSELLAQEGENVGPGTVMLRMRSMSDATLYAYIDLKQARYAQEDQPVCLKLPDGEIVNARVAHPPQTAQAVPADIRAAFSSQKRDLLVTIQPDEALPSRWMVHQLPLRVRFLCGWPFGLLW